MEESKVQCDKRCTQPVGRLRLHRARVLCFTLFPLPLTLKQPLFDILKDLVVLFTDLVRVDNMIDLFKQMIL